MKRLLRGLVFAIVAGCAALRVVAAETSLSQDLGGGLAYLRPSPDAEGLAGFERQIAAPGSLVLDLRYTGNLENPAGWLAALRPFAAGKRVCLVLVTPVTSAALLAGLDARLPGVVSIGYTSPAYTPDIAVEIPGETDRRAFELLGQGTPLAQVLTENADKPRYDEAAILRERAQAAAPPAETDDESPAKPAAEPDAKAAAKARPVLDAVLQRAVQIHRGLVALKKL